MPSQSQRERSEAREQRRNGQDESSTNEQKLDGVKQAAKVAAASIALGAVTAAAKALAERRHEKSEDEERPQQQAPEPQAEQPEPAQPESSQPEPESVPEGPEPEPAQDEPESARREPEPEQRQPKPESEPRHEPVAGATQDEASRAVDQARRDLELLLGKTPESVSSMERTDDGWLVTVEVVEVSRIPESTDVLASYEVELDDELNLRRYARVRRYNRSQADREEL